MCQQVTFVFKACGHRQPGGTLDCGLVPVYGRMRHRTQGNVDKEYSGMCQACYNLHVKNFGLYVEGDPENLKLRPYYGPK